MKPIEWNSLPGPADISRFKLANGITLLVRTNDSSPSVVIGGYLPCGSLFDPDEKLGLADFTASGLLRGTQARSFQQIFDELESSAASLSFSGGTHSSGFTGRCLAEDLPRLLSICSDALRQPVFPDDQMERLRSQILTGLAIRAQDTAEMASLTFDGIIFKDHPYSRPDDGYPETIQAIQVSDIRSFHQHHYGPHGLVLAVVGSVDPRAVKDMVENVLGDWVNTSQPPLPNLPELKPIYRTVSRKVTIPGKSQSDLVIGSLSLRRTDPDYMAASLGNSILGQFGMGGRIGEVVRERSGLAYYASSSLNAGIGPGSWEVSAGVNPANVRRVRTLIVRELQRFVDKGIEDEELSDVKANYIGRLPLSLESNAGVCNTILSMERFDLGLDYLYRYPGLVSEVTADEVVAVARKYLHPDRLAVAVAGQ